MATVEDIARGTLAAISGTSANHVLVGQWVSDAYNELATQVRLRHLRRQGALSLVAEVAAGTVTATRGSDIVVGDATAAAAWTPSVVGRHIRIRTTWYEILAVAGTNLTLEAPYSEDTATAVAYRIVQRHAVLPQNARWPTNMTLMRAHRPLDFISLEELNALAPARTTVGTAGPTVWADAGRNRRDERIIELYPYTTVAEAVHYDYFVNPGRLGLQAELPVDVDAHILREGALVHLFRFEEGAAAKAGNIEAAALWRNEWRAQRTEWKNRLREAIAVDRAVDDGTIFVGQKERFAEQGVPTARGHVIGSWS